MISFLDYWRTVAAQLLSQALAGELEFIESAPESVDKETLGFAATIDGDHVGRFSAFLDATIFDVPLLESERDQRAAWRELLCRIAESAARDMQNKSGMKCRIEKFGECEEERESSCAFRLKSSAGMWVLRVRDEVQERQGEPVESSIEDEPDSPSTSPAPKAGIRPGMELLLDVELEAALRFGCRELSLGELLDLGPGDLVQLDRHAEDPVDLIVGDKIVARGEVVLVNGDFGLRVTEVAAPRKRLESIRCLF